MSNPLKLRGRGRPPRVPKVVAESRRRAQRYDKELQEGRSIAARLRFKAYEVADQVQAMANHGDLQGHEMPAKPFVGNRVPHISLRDFTERLAEATCGILATVKKEKEDNSRRVRVQGLQVLRKRRVSRTLAAPDRALQADLDAYHTYKWLRDEAVATTEAIFAHAGVLVRRFNNSTHALSKWPVPPFINISSRWLPHSMTLAIARF